MERAGDHALAFQLARVAQVDEQRAACAEHLDAAIAKARRDGVLHGLTIAREHAVAVIDGGTGEPAIDWTDVTVATGDALTTGGAQ